MGLVVFVGNCHAQSLCQLYDDFIRPEGAPAATYVPSYVAATPAAREAVSAASLVVDQVFSFEQLFTPEPPARARRIGFPYVTGLFIWSYATEAHVNRAFFPVSGAMPYDGEIGDAYLNRLIRQGVPAAEASRRYLDLDIIRHAQVERRTEILAAQQEQRDDRCDFPTQAFVTANLATGSLFMTHGHPDRDLLLFVAREVFTRCGFDAAAIANLGHNVVQVPGHRNYAAVHPAIGRFFGMPAADPKNVNRRPKRTPHRRRKGTPFDVV